MVAETGATASLSQKQTDGRAFSLLLDYVYCNHFVNCVDNCTIKQYVYTVQLFMH